MMDKTAKKVRAAVCRSSYPGFLTIGRGSNNLVSLQLKFGTGKTLITEVTPEAFALALTGMSEMPVTVDGRNVTLQYETAEAADEVRALRAQVAALQAQLDDSERLNPAMIAAVRTIRRLRKAQADHVGALSDSDVLALEFGTLDAEALALVLPQKDAARILSARYQRAAQSAAEDARDFAEEEYKRGLEESAVTLDACKDTITELVDSVQYYLTLEAPDDADREELRSAAVKAAL